MTNGINSTALLVPCSVATGIPLEHKRSASRAVYHVGTYDGQSPNGIHRVIYSYCQLLKNDVDCHVVTFDAPDGSQVVHEQVDNVSIHRFPSPKGKGITLPRSLKQWIRGVSKDSIFHLHGVFWPPVYAFSRILRRNGVRYIYTPHDSYSGASLSRKRLAKAIYIRLCERPILQSAFRVHALSSDGVKDIRRITSNEITLVPNFVLPLPCDETPLEKRNCVTFVGRLDIYQKGLDLALRAFARFRELVADSPPFVLVGPEQHLSVTMLKQQCSELNLEAGRDVRFAGQVNEDEKAVLLTSSRAYLQLSRFEGFGLSIVEAISLGVPVVISDRVPIADEIAASGGGCAVANVEDAARALEQIWKLSDEEYASLSDTARRCYETRFSPAAVGQQVLNLYEVPLQSRSTLTPRAVAPRPPRFADLPLVL